MGLNPEIRYIGLDFDGCICDANPPFWSFIEILKDLEARRYPYARELYEQWIRILARETAEGRCGLIRPDMIRFLQRIHTEIPFLDQPYLFVYTNNQSREIVGTVGNILREVLGRRAPWREVFHPQDPCREDEIGSETSAKLKSFQGIMTCLEFPDDLTVDSLLFLDDQEHPLISELGSKYVRVPEYKNPDSIVYYLRTLTLAMFTVVADHPGRKLFFEVVGANLGIEHVKLELVTDDQIRGFLKDCEEADATNPRPMPAGQPFHDTMLQQLEPYFVS